MAKTKSFTVKIDPEYQDTFDRYCEEKGVTQKEGAQYFTDTGLRRKTSLYIDRDKAGKKRPSSGRTKKTAKKKAAAKRASKKTGKKTGKKKAAKKTARRSKVTKKASSRSSKKKANGKAGGLSADQKSAIAKLKEEGFNNKDIAEQLDLSKDQVYRALKSMK